MIGSVFLGMTVPSNKLYLFPLTNQLRHILHMYRNL